MSPSERIRKISCSEQDKYDLSRTIAMQSIIIEKYQELVKAWEDTAIMAGASKHLKMTERISKIEQELQALKAE